MKNILLIGLLFISIAAIGQVKYSVISNDSLITVAPDGTLDTLPTTNLKEATEYVALLSQSSTGAPTVVKEYKNTIGTIAWTYSTTGTYVATVSGVLIAFPQYKMVGEAYLQERGSNPRYYVLGRTSDTTATLTAMNSSLAASDPSSTNLIYVKITVFQ